MSCPLKALQSLWPSAEDMMASERRIIFRCWNPLNRACYCNFPFWDCIRAVHTSDRTLTFKLGLTCQRDSSMGPPCFCFVSAQPEYHNINVRLFHRVEEMLSSTKNLQTAKMRTRHELPPAMLSSDSRHQLRGKWVWFNPNRISEEVLDFTIYLCISHELKRTFAYMLIFIWFEVKMMSNWHFPQNQSQQLYFELSG